MPRPVCNSHLRVASGSGLLVHLSVKRRLPTLAHGAYYPASAIPAGARVLPGREAIEVATATGPNLSASAWHTVLAQRKDSSRSPFVLSFGRALQPQWSTLSASELWRGVIAASAGIP